MSKSQLRKRFYLLLLLALWNCFPKTNADLLTVALLNNLNIITPGVLVSITPGEGQRVTNFDGRVIATFRKPLLTSEFQAVRSTSDCTRTEINFLVYQTTTASCATGNVAISTDRRTLTFTAGTNLSPATYQVRIQNIFDQNENRVDYQSQTGFTIQSSSSSTGTVAIGGTITGNSGSGLALSLNSGTSVAISTGATNYSFPNVPAGNYSLSIQTNPSGLVCTFSSNSSFTISGSNSDANISSLNISCTALASVAAVYPTNGANWNNYVQYSLTPTLINGVETPFAETDTACTPTVAYRSCVHGGVLKQIPVNFLNSCAGITAYDYDSNNNLVNAFQWRCMVDNSGNYWIRSSGLRDDKGLRDLINFTGNAWKIMKVRIFRNGTQFLETPATQWWTNTIVDQIICPTTPATGTVLIVRDVTCGGTINLTNSRIAIVSRSGTVITTNGALAYFSNGNFNWLEVNMLSNGTPGSAVNLNPASFWHIRNSTFNGYGTNQIFVLNSVNNIRIHGNYASGNTGFSRFLFSGSGNPVSNVITNNKAINFSSAFATPVAVSSSVTTNRYNIFIGNIFGNMNGSTSATGIGGNFINNFASNTFVFGLTGAGGRTGITNGTSQGNGVFQNINVMGSQIGYNIPLNISASRVINSAFLQTSTNAVSLASGGILNTFLGKLITDSTCASPNVSQISSPSCSALSPSSHALVTTAAPYTSDFVGLVSDSVNAIANPTAATNTATSAFSLTDWFNFENDMRTYVISPTINFPDFSNMGNCTGATNCRIVDLSLSVTGTNFRNVNPCPSGSTTYQPNYFDPAFTNTATCVSNGMRGLTFQSASTCVTDALQHAVELLDDGIGNDNGFCESNEDCLYTPNIHAYQGHHSNANTFRDLIPASQFTPSTTSCSDIGTGGIVQNVRLWKYDTNGR